MAMYGLHASAYGGQGRQCAKRILQGHTGRIGRRCCHYRIDRLKRTRQGNRKAKGFASGGDLNIQAKGVGIYLPDAKISLRINANCPDNNISLCQLIFQSHNCRVIGI